MPGSFSVSRRMATSVSRRTRMTSVKNHLPNRLSHSQWGQSVVPGFAIGPFEHGLCLRVAPDLFFLGIPPDLSPQAQGDVGEVAGGGYPVAPFNIGGGRGARFNTVYEIASVRCEQVVRRRLLERFGPKFSPCLRVVNDPAYRLTEK